MTYTINIKGFKPLPRFMDLLYTTNDQALFFKNIYRTIHKENTWHKVKRRIFDKKSIKVAVQDGFYKLLEIQLPGKTENANARCLNGFSLDENAKSWLIPLLWIVSIDCKKKALLSTKALELSTKKQFSPCFLLALTNKSL